MSSHQCPRASGSTKGPLLQRVVPQPVKELGYGTRGHQPFLFTIGAQRIRLCDVFTSGVLVCRRRVYRGSDWSDGSIREMLCRPHTELKSSQGSSSSALSDVDVTSQTRQPATGIPSKCCGSKGEPGYSHCYPLIHPSTHALVDRSISMFYSFFTMSLCRYARMSHLLVMRIQSQSESICLIRNTNSAESINSMISEIYF